MLRRTAAGMALALALAVPLTGCGALTGASSTGAGADASAAPSVDAAKVLTDAVAKTSRVNVKAVLAGDTQDQDVTAVYDVHKKMAEITSKVDKDQLRIVLTSTDMYLGGLSDFQGQTLRLRLNKLTADSSFNLFADILAPLHILGNATNVTATSSTKFAGQLDFTKVSTKAVGTRKFLDYVIKAGGDKVRSLDFTASTNGDGYLTSFDVTLPAIDSGNDSDYQVNFSDFGKPVNVKKPTSGIIEAPAEIYST